MQPQLVRQKLMRCQSIKALLIAAMLAPTVALAAPEDRGIRGWYVGGGGGIALGLANDTDGANPGSFFGNMGRLRVGEEAIPNLYLGLAFAGGAGSADTYDAGFGGLILEAGWRALPSALPDLVLLGGVGVGGGSLTATNDEDLDASPGGALYQLGLMWEFTFGDEPEGFVLAPSVHWYVVPAQFDNDAQLQAVLIGIESIWYGGR